MAINGKSYDEANESGELDQEQPPIHCPKCESTDWFCWDERSITCWTSGNAGEPAGYAMTMVVGYLGCKQCDTRWTDISVDPRIDDPDCDCEDW